MYTRKKLQESRMQDLAVMSLDLTLWEWMACQVGNQPSYVAMLSMFYSFCMLLIVSAQPFLSPYLQFLSNLCRTMQMRTMMRMVDPRKIKEGRRALRRLPPRQSRQLLRFFQRQPPPPPLTCRCTGNLLRDILQACLLRDGRPVLRTASHPTLTASRTRR
jgi:hypothetical protein